MIYILINKINYKKFLLGAGATLGVVTFGVLSSNLNANASTRNGNVITVESGDTLSEIATTYNTSVDQLVNDNNITNQDFISVGQQLNLTEINNNQVANTTMQTASASQPVQNTTTTTSPTQPSSQSTTNSSNLSGSEQQAKDWIAQHESGGSYNAQNGQYYGRYQLSSSYLNGDYSAANQEKVADNYCLSRYGSWSAAKNFWLSHNYY